MEKKFDPDDVNLIIKRYKVRRSRPGTSLETTIPREVFAREARRLGLDPETAAEEVFAVWRYNSFEGLHLSFEKKE